MIMVTVAARMTDAQMKAIAEYTSARSARRVPEPPTRHALVNAPVPPKMPRPRIAALNVYPVKSCGGIALATARVGCTRTGCDNPVRGA